MSDEHTIESHKAWCLGQLDYWAQWEREAEVKLKIRTWSTSWAIIKKEKQAVQRQFTIEIRVDCPDADKLEVFREVMRSAGQNVYAHAMLLGGQSKPQIAIFSDDFFDGHVDIKLFENRIAEGEAALAAAGDTSVEEGVSAELLAAVSGDDPK